MKKIRPQSSIQGDASTQLAVVKKQKFDDWSKEQFIAEIDQLRESKKYGLVWEEKLEDVVEQCKHELPVLEEVESRAIETNNSGEANLIIEGDNYHALSVLNYTHAGKVDVIYIDPPYNTGNEGFVYNDKIIDREDPYRHSKWLSFMDKRLRLSQRLLKDTGTIFISIDDNEQAQLKLLCDGIFKKENYIATFIWKSRQATGKQVALSNISNEHEYVLAYRKGTGKFFKGSERNRASYKNPDNDPRGDWAKHPLDIGATQKERPNCFYVLVDPRTGIRYSANPNRVWAFSKESMAKLISERKIIFDTKGKNRPALKKFFSELKSEKKPFSSLLSGDESDVGYNTEGTKLLNNIFSGQKVFDYPKPVSLIRTLVDQVADKNSIVLDFMAGSGTTAQAVLELNKKNNGNRKFILCTNNENNICTDICYPRIKKVINGYKNLKGEKIEGLGGNLRYFKTAFVPKDEVSDNTRRSLVARCVDMIRVRENAFTKKQDNKRYKIYTNEKIATGILFDLDAIDEFKKKLSTLRLPAQIYVFSLTNDTFADDFADLLVRHTLCPIPESILEVYRKLFK
jgi:adenine-specific DNA-methyltransferase